MLDTECYDAWLLALDSTIIHKRRAAHWQNMCGLYGIGASKWKYVTCPDCLKEGKKQ